MISYASIDAKSQQCRNIQPMLDTTPYADKLTPALNSLLKSFAGGECIMVRKIKSKDTIKGKAGNCHINVKQYVDKDGGSSISGWLLGRIPHLIEKGMYVWNFHSVWLKPDNKLIDVTDDQHYLGRDKTIFVPDSTRVPDLTEGTSFNSFLVFTERAFAEHYGKSIGKEIRVNTPYWCDNTMTRLIDIDKHSGVYRLLSTEYKHNYQRMCDEYELDIVNGKPVPKVGSKYEFAVPVEMMFDYSVSSN